MTLRVAIIGTGFGAKTQLPGFRLAGGWEVVSLTGSDPAKTSRLATELGVPRALTDAAQAIEAGDPDLVCISTPPGLHLPMGLAALDAARHCLLEKPMAMDAGEAARLADASARTPRLALIDHELRALPSRREMRRRIAAGDIGRPLTARVTFTSHGRARPGTTWNWWARASHGGGILGAIGSHVVDTLLWWLGDITEAEARLTTSIPELPDAAGTLREVDSDDGADLWLGFDSGVTGTVSLTTVADAYRGFSWEIYGTEGGLRIEPDDRLWGSRRAGKDPVDLSLPDGLGDGPVIDGTHWARGFVLLARAIGEAIREDGAIPFAASFADGLRTQRVLDAARRSSDAGRKVSVSDD